MEGILLAPSLRRNRFRGGFQQTQTSQAYREQLFSPNQFPG
jgi:hypothetical protein